LAPPERFLGIRARHYFLSPMASPSVPDQGNDPVKQSNTRKATDYCLAHPQWRLTLQMHKILGID
ncbi:MAG TPA: 7-carboxy-7-deazaguanine synthase, partial [Marinobacter sp.]|nr:7-carboxy-7-deazaguanine synthase [Marinobacter sp.]